MTKSLSFMPTSHYELMQLGDGDQEKTRKYLLVIGAFLGGYSKNTQSSYRVALRQFFELFEWICPDKVTIAHAVAFKRWLLETKKVSPETTYYRICAMSSFFDFMRQPLGASAEPLVAHNPFDVVPRNDIKPTPYGRAKAMDWKTFQTILDGLPSDNVGMRDKAILIFLAFTGRRRTEVASMRMRDLDLTSRPRQYTVRVKGNAVKTFELPNICYDTMRAYWIMANRLKDLRPDSGVFTPSRACPLTSSGDLHRPLSNRSINEILSRAALRAGVDMQNVRVHAIRHMAARDLDNAGIRLQDIQAFLGHASPNTTQVYLQKLSGPAAAHENALIEIRQATERLASGVSRDTR